MLGLANLDMLLGFATPLGGVACTSGLNVSGNALLPRAAIIISSGLGPNSSKLESADTEGVLVMLEAVTLLRTIVPRPL